MEFVLYNHIPSFCNWPNFEFFHLLKLSRPINIILTLYKHYFGKKHSIPLDKIQTHFALLKRTAKSGQKTEIVKLSLWFKFKRPTVFKLYWLPSKITVHRFCSYHIWQTTPLLTLFCICNCLISSAQWGEHSQ